MKSILLILGLGLFISACNPNKAQSLLSDAADCSLDTCDYVQDKIEGDLAISSDLATYQKNVDQGDVVEISGSCTDLGVRENYIHVQVFESEDTSSEITKYLDNDVDYNCVNSVKTPVMNGQKCIWVNQGNVYIDANSSQPRREFPQCFNGRFSFSVRLGRIMRTTEGGGASSDDGINSRIKYAVRFQLKTYDGKTNPSSQWSYAYVDRGVSKVAYSTYTLDSPGGFKMNIGAGAFKGLAALTNITYTGTLTREYVDGTLDAPLSIYPIPLSLAYPVVPDVSVLDWNLQGMAATTGYRIPGVKHKVVFKAQDTDPTHVYGYVEESQPSEELVVLPVEFYVGLDSGRRNPATACNFTPSDKYCEFSVNFPPISFGNLEWMVIKGKSSGVWPKNYEPASTVPCTPYPGTNPTGGVSAAEACNYIAPLPNAHTFRFTPRGYHSWSCISSTDNTYAGTYTTAVRYRNGAFKGEWSKADDASCLITPD